MAYRTVTRFAAPEAAQPARTQEASATNSAADVLPTATPGEARLIRKYPNRRLYDAVSSSYVTLDDIRKLILDGETVRIEDAKTHEDLTRGVLFQLILDLENAAGAPLFGVDLLTQLVRFYGHAMQGLMGDCIAQNLQIFSQLQMPRFPLPAGQPANGQARHGSLTGAHPNEQVPESSASGKPVSALSAALPHHDTASATVPPPLEAMVQWNSFMQTQIPAMQQMMNAYLNQSASLFLDVQQRMQQQTQQISQQLWASMPPFDTEDDTR